MLEIGSTGEKCVAAARLASVAACGQPTIPGEKEMGGEPKGPPPIEGKRLAPYFFFFAAAFFFGAAFLAGAAFFLAAIMGTPPLCPQRRNGKIFGRHSLKSS
jgi:hypothetical protein